MQPNTSVVGGKPTTPFGNSFVDLLQGLLGGEGSALGGIGSFRDTLTNLLSNNVGSDAAGRILSGVGEVGLDPGSEIGAQLEELTTRRRNLGQANLRERFGGTNPYSTSAALAESEFLAQEAPTTGLALAEIDRALRGQDLGALLSLFNTTAGQQSNVIGQLLQAMTGITGASIPQAQVAQSGSTLGNIFSLLTSGTDILSSLSGIGLFGGSGIEELLKELSAGRTDGRT